MNEFLKFFDEKIIDFPMHMTISYNKVCDWTINIWKRGCAKNYPKSKSYNNDAIICDVQDCDVGLAFAKAHVALKEWLLENEGEY